MGRETFREWLGRALEEGDVSRHELARRLADQHPGNGNPEDYRRTVRRILKGDTNPSQPTRDAITEALGRTDAPRADEEDRDETITRDEFRIWQSVNARIIRGVPVPLVRT